jgi:hypothetical protein
MVGRSEAVFMKMGAVYFSDAIYIANAKLPAPSETAGFGGG